MRIALLLILAFLQLAPPTITATLTPQGVVVLWSADRVVCPWLEYGTVQAYAGGAQPCRAAGSALVTLVPDLPARVVLRTEDGQEVAAASVGYRLGLPIIIAPQTPP